MLQVKRSIHEPVLSELNLKPKCYLKQPDMVLHFSAITYSCCHHILFILFQHDIFILT